jgi:hypothetical protein
MKRAIKISMIAIALTFPELNSYAQQPTHQKIQLAQAQSDTTIRKMRPQKAKADTTRGKWGKSDTTGVHKMKKHTAKPDTSGMH